MRNAKVLLAVILVCSLFLVEQQSALAEPRVLNNLVTELVNLESIAAKPAYQEISFTNPREGWIFVSGSINVKTDDVVAISIDDAGKEDAVLNYQFGDATTKETMRFLSAGDHKLRIWFPENPELATLDVRNLIIRAVPAMVYCGHPSVAMGGYGVYDFKFLEKDILPNINTIVGTASLSLQDLHKQWKQRGGQWYLEQNLPSFFKGSREDLPDPLTGDAVYNYWTKSAGFINPYVDGVYGDEYMWKTSQIPDFPAYVAALKRIAANEKFKNKKVHGWTFGKEMYTEPAGKELMQTFIDSGAKIAWEYYAGERDTADVLRKELYGNLGDTIKGMEKSIPGMVKSIVFTIGNFSAPPHSINSDPHVDFKVHLDEQFNYLANAPECAGLFGIMGYKARYADEEYVRWTGRLFRHYCIEGKTGLLSDQLGFKYVPGHITNADFDDGLEGWTVTAAAPDSVRAGTISRLSAMLGRFTTPEHGDNHLWTRRSADKPNKVSQEIKNLVPGKLYSAKLYVGDYQDYVKGESVRKTLSVSLNIDNVDMIQEKYLVLEVKGIQHASVGTFKGKKPPWMIHYRLVFRAKDTTAELTISDWADSTTPGGPIGQEILYNFVEVQPYIED